MSSLAGSILCAVCGESHVAAAILGLDNTSVAAIAATAAAATPCLQIRQLTAYKAKSSLETRRQSSCVPPLRTRWNKGLLKIRSISK